MTERKKLILKKKQKILEDRRNFRREKNEILNRKCRSQMNLRYIIRTLLLLI